MKDWVMYGEGARMKMSLDMCIQTWIMKLFVHILLRVRLTDIWLSQKIINYDQFWLLNSDNICTNVDLYFGVTSVGTQSVHG